MASIFLAKYEARSRAESWDRKRYWKFEEKKTYIYIGTGAKKAELDLIWVLVLPNKQRAREWIQGRD